MTIKRDPSGRLQIDSPFVGESMMDKSLLASTDTSPSALNGENVGTRIYKA